MTATDYRVKREALGLAFDQSRSRNGPIGLKKPSSNLFRYRQSRESVRLDVSDFNEVIAIDSNAQVVEVEGMTTYERLADATMAIGLMPVWVCPVMSYDPGVTFGLYDMNPETLYLNLGFWGFVWSSEASGFLNRRIEETVDRLGGRKSLYSDSYYSEADFWRLYNRGCYDALKARYDPDGTFLNLYQKCVQQKQLANPSSSEDFKS